MIARMLRTCCSVMSHSLWSYGLQHARLLCPSLSPRVYSNLCPLSWWCYLTISTSIVPLSFCFQSFPSGYLPVNLLFSLDGQKYWSFGFSISPSSEYSELISFRIDCLDFLAGQGILKSLSPTPQFEGISYLVLSLFYCTALTSLHDYWKNHNFDYMDLCWQSNVSDF